MKCGGSDEVESWYKYSSEEVVQKLKTDRYSGLTREESLLRLERYGANELAETRGRTIGHMILDQFRDFMVLVLIAAAVVSGLLSEFADSLVIVAIVVLNAVLGVIQENKAEKSLAALKNMASPTAKTLRGGDTVVIRSGDLVPGDIVFLEAGDLVPADGRLLEAAGLRVEEAALTGESVPVDKQTGPVSGDGVALGDIKNMAFAGSTVIYGRGVMVVTGTGMDTEIGKVAGLIQNEDNTETPLQKRLADLGKKLGILSVAASLILFLLGLLTGEQPIEMFLTAVSMAVAVIPEGLPATVTIVLAVGVQRMIKRNAIIRKLPAVETLGAATVICSDKTGTLTQNKMTVEEIWAGGLVYNVASKHVGPATIDGDITMALRAGVMANDAKLTLRDAGKWEASGDPTETAIVIAAAQLGLIKYEMEAENPRVLEIPFDSDRKLMTTIHQRGSGFTVYVKGAPDLLATKCSRLISGGRTKDLSGEYRQQIIEANTHLAEKGLRVLGMAYKEITELPQELNVVESDLVFAGLIGMVDPPREEAFEAVRKTVEAGIRPCMITGDHEITARAIAGRLGITREGDLTVTGGELEKMTDDQLAKNVGQYSVFSRVSPEHKLRIVKALQANRQVVAMTGDGVNDAPALKKADIGAAMGIIGTEVAKQASDMILTDDNYATVVAAVEEGRSIYANIKKSIYYLLSCNAGEIIVLFLALLVGLPRPLLPIQILWVNLVTDSLPGLALGLEPPERDIMKRPPRDPDEKILTKNTGLRLLLEGMVIAAVTLFAFLVGLSGSLEQARTMAFLTLSFSQKAHAFNKRSDTKSLWAIGWFSNRYLVLGVLVSTVVQLSVVFIPFLQKVFKVTALTGEQWLIVWLMSLTPLILVESVKGIRHLRRRLEGFIS